LPKIREGLEHGEGDCLTEEHIYKSILAGQMGMWVIHNPEIVGAVIFSILEYPAKKTIFVEMLVGENLSSWIQGLQDTARKYKQEIGADTIEASCRKGFLRVLRDWRTKAYQMELP